MSARAILAMAGALGALPPLRFKSRRKRTPNPTRESAAVAKRARKAAKRAEDARRTEAGRAFNREWWRRRPRRGLWDVERERFKAELRSLGARGGLEWCEVSYGADDADAAIDDHAWLKTAKEASDDDDTW